MSEGVTVSLDPAKNMGQAHGTDGTRRHDENERAVARAVPDHRRQQGYHQAAPACFCTLRHVVGRDEDAKAADAAARGAGVQESADRPGSAVRRAGRASFTAASGCPARTRHPAVTCAKRETCPGVTMCRRLVKEAIAVTRASARSAAERPVVSPSRARIEIVKAVAHRVVLAAAISGRPSASVITRQMDPLSSMTMQLPATASAQSAGIKRSPSVSLFSFSFSFSTRTAMQQARAAATGSSAVATGISAWSFSSGLPPAHPSRRCARSRRAWCCRGARAPPLLACRS